MNDEYLWNKAGSDAEIERIENALKAFRFVATEPPAVTTKGMSLPEKRPFNFFKLGFALALAAAVVVVMSAIWLRTPANHPVDGNESAKANEPKNALPIIPPGASKTPVTEPPQPKPEIVRAKLPSTVTTRAIRVVAKRQEKLTPEETHAYNQLMLALAITSNELKIVKDKINGREERTAADDRQK